ncbi:MAG: DUF368 domain-containing protein [Gammaproteobacteria bacterium]|nr:MAG: DUF368 domain-containing protein [Gammaproteobacteria bacterium]
MGAADIVPGVSGGTIAFISGIYERLLAALSSFAGPALTHLAQGRFKAFWSAVDASFLCVLFSGILLSIFSLSSTISYLLANWPHLVWAFFLGLVLASVWHVAKTIRQWSVNRFLALSVGAGIAYFLTAAQLSQLAPEPENIFLAGFIAISAMILPGISGSFILLILGLYQHVLGAIKSLDMVTIGVFASGCVLGLLVMAKFLTWAFRKYHDLTMALLTGFLIGALNKLWPWKQTISWNTNSHGEKIPFEQIPVSPLHFEQITGTSSDLVLALILLFAGVGLVVSIEVLTAHRQ